MDFLVIGRDGSDSYAPARRQGMRARHLEGATSAFSCGAWLDAAALLDEQGAMVGSVILCRFDSREALDRWLADEPYVTGGVWKSVEVIPVKIPPPFSGLHDLRRMDLSFVTRTETFAISRLPPETPPPEWLAGAGWYSLTKTEQELSVVCEESRVPDEVRCEPGWAMLEVEGPIPFEAVGVLGAIASLLAAAAIPLFVISTFDRDAVLVKREHVDDAARMFTAAGARVR